jgi:hypothetical protein
MSESGPGHDMTLTQGMTDDSLTLVSQAIFDLRFSTMSGITDHRIEQLTGTVMSLSYH